MKNVIAYVAPKKKTMAHSTIPNNRISFVVGISVFGFKTYWVKVFNLMDIKTTPTFKQFLQAKTINAKKNEPYYQCYDVKILRDFHKQAMIKQQIYKNNYNQLYNLLECFLLFQTDEVLKESLHMFDTQKD